MKFNLLKKNPVLHPIFFSLFPIIFLFGYNIDQVYKEDILFPALISLSITLFSFVLITKITRNIRESGIAISAFLILFFSYGHLREYLLSFNKYHINRYGDIYLLSLWGLLLIISLIFIIKTKSDLINFTKILNFISASLIIISLIPIFSFEIQRDSDLKFPLKKIDMGSEKSDPVKNKTTELPDIYYIILDGYAGEWTLKNIYNFDNSPFLKYLGEKGFFVLKNSRSNYVHTSLSLASSLNMMYVNKIINKKYQNEANMQALYNIIQNNMVLNFLKELGYVTIHLRSRAVLTNNNPHADMDIDFSLVDEFSIVLLKTTLFAPFAEKLGFFNILRRRILNVFRKIPELAMIKKPTYTFAHIMAPHPPYLFKKNGLPNKVSIGKMIGFNWTDRKGYLGQLQYVNTLVKKMVDKILLNSSKTPVIIIQSDHGTASLLEDPKTKRWKKATVSMLKERFNILNALLLPDVSEKKIPLDLTPVNTFRLILNEYFKKNYKFLNNSNYFSTMSSIFFLIENLTGDFK